MENSQARRSALQVYGCVEEKSKLAITQSVSVPTEAGSNLPTNR